MKGLFWLPLLLTHPCGTESREKNESCLSQPRRVISHKIGQSAVLPCIVSDCSGENLHHQWFVFRENHHFSLTLTTRHSLDAASLHISSLNTNDSGVYYCAVNSTSGKECCRHHVGLGTTLVVSEHMKPQVRQRLLWSSFALLAIYNLALLALFVLKKHGCKITICKQTSKSDKAVQQGGGRKKTQFHDVLQELHSRGNFTKSKQTRRNHSPVGEVNGERNNSPDDIYQNV